MKKILAILLAVLMCAPVVCAAEIPTLFHNDDAWYKDGVSPMLEREGKRYIPADIFTMFDYMSVTTPTSDNLLIHNTETGQYVSLLFMQQSALINGELYENIGLFRDGGVYYVEADAVLEGLGFMTRLYICEDGSVSMQICDAGVVSETFTELVKSYLPEEETGDDYTDEEIPENTDDGAALIYLFCAEPDPASEFTAQEALEDGRLDYTIFLDGENDGRNVIRYSVGQLCGLLLPETEDAMARLGEINEEFLKITRRRVSLILSSGDEETDESLRSAGYYPVKPDFEVNGSSDPESLIWEIKSLANEKGSCTLWLEDCWNTVEIARMIAELDEEQYRTANFADPAPDRSAPAGQ